MRRYCQVYILILITVICKSAYPGNINELRNLLNVHDYESAYSLASSMLFENEGLVEFDFLYSISALETGHSDQAIFALERLIANQPDNQRARLDLARAYYLNGEFTKSKTLFSLMLETSPPENVKNNINLFLTKIDSFLNTASYQTSAFTEFAIGWDNNINTASDETSVTLGNLVFKLNSNDKIDAAYAKLTAGGNYLKRINKVDSFFFGGQIETRDNLSQNLDTNELSIRTGYLHINNNTRVSVPVSYQKINLDGKSYRDLLSITGEWTTFTSEFEYNSYIIQYGTINYPNQPALDLQFFNLGYANNFLINSNKDKLLSVSTFLGAESPKTKGNEINMKNYIGLAVNISNPSSLGFYTGLNTYYFNYQAKNPSFGKTRNDLLVNGQLGYKWGLTKSWQLSSQLGYSKNISNIDIYSYDRIIAELKTRVEF